MSKTNLEQNTIGLEEILTAVNELPEAGSGDSGGSVETCTVEIDNSLMNYSDFHICYTLYLNGAVETIDVTSTGENEFILDNVIIGSKLIFILGEDALDFGAGYRHFEFSGGVLVDKILAEYAYMARPMTQICLIDVTASGTIIIQ